MAAISSPPPALAPLAAPPSPSRSAAYASAAALPAAASPGARTRARASTASSLSPTLSSKSAPTSPVARARDLGPLRGFTELSLSPVQRPGGGGGGGGYGGGGSGPAGRGSPHQRKASLPDTVPRAPPAPAQAQRYAPLAHPALPHAASQPVPHAHMRLAQQVPPQLLMAAAAGGQGGAAYLQHPQYAQSQPQASPAGAQHAVHASQPLAHGSLTHAPATGAMSALSQLPPAQLQAQAAVRRRPSRTRGAPSSPQSSETEVDSDSTFVPGRGRHHHSRSQPDLSALRHWATSSGSGLSVAPLTNLAALPSLGGGPAGRAQAQAAYAAWSPVEDLAGPPAQVYAGDLARKDGSTLHRRRSARRTPPSSPKMSRSPRGSSTQISPLMPMSALAPLSDDADDDYESTDSPSSGSLTFSPKRRFRPPPVVRRESGNTTASAGHGHGHGLGLDTGERHKADTPPRIEAILRHSSLLPLRLLAVVPAAWGVGVLIEALVSGGLWEEMWPWGVDVSRDALERVVSGAPYEGTWTETSRGDMVLAIAWAVCTAHFCFTLTTGLTHRWRSYYSLPSTLTRLVSLQCLCWPATYLTLWTLGARRPLLAWVVIGVTTGWSRTVQMWVTSNVEVPRGDETPRRGAHDTLPDGPVPDGAGWWVAFRWGRTWDWDAVARKVGWKVGALLIVTAAWLFWGIETGRFEGQRRG